MSIIQEAEVHHQQTIVNKKGKGEMPTASHTYKLCVCIMYACVNAV